MSGIFGFSTEPSSGGDFTAVCKYDARAGKMFRRDRVDTGGGFVSEDEDITNSFKAQIDFENLETGWMHFAPGSAPSFALVPMGSQIPPRPTPDHKNGIRVMLKLGKACAGDKPIRELTNSSKAFLSGMEKLYLAYQAERDQHPGELPLVTLEKTVPVKSGSGTTSSTNYAPVFKITGWAARGDLVFVPRSGAPAAPSPAPATPPATGSTRVDPPAAKPAPQPAMAEADDDFG